MVLDFGAALSMPRIVTHRVKTFAPDVVALDFNGTLRVLAQKRKNK